VTGSLLRFHFQMDGKAIASTPQVDGAAEAFIPAA
jgi:hypothetical protein